MHSADGSTTNEWKIGKNLEGECVSLKYSDTSANEWPC